MPTYHAPVDDGLFLLRDVLRVQDRGDLPGFEELTPEFCAEVLGAAARFHEEVLHPLNKPGDDEGARLEDGRVRTPAGFREAWKQYRAAGWSRHFNEFDTRRPCQHGRPSPRTGSSRDADSRPVRSRDRP